MHTSEEICEALVRHVETSGSEVFEKNFIKGDKIVCTVWCMIGPNAQWFNKMIKKAIKKKGFKQS